MVDDFRKGPFLLRKLLVVCTLIGFIGFAGCADPVARQRTIAREQAVAVTIQSLAVRERQRPSEVRNDLLSAGQMIRDAEHQRIEDNRIFAHDWKQEVQRWQKRQPEYVEEAGKLFGGDMQRAHATAVQMID